MKQMIYRFEKGNLNQLEYWFDGHIEKGGSEANVKRWFVELMTNAPLFPNDLSLTGQAWFDVIWANTGTPGNNGLRQSLFGTRSKGDAEDYFVQTLISSIGSSFYNFIKVR